MRRGDLRRAAEIYRGTYGPIPHDNYIGKYMNGHLKLRRGGEKIYLAVLEAVEERLKQESRILRIVQSRKTRLKQQLRP